MMDTETIYDPVEAELIANRDVDGLRLYRHHKAMKRTIEKEYALKSQNLQDEFYDRLHSINREYAETVANLAKEKASQTNP